MFELNYYHLYKYPKCQVAHNISTNKKKSNDKY